MTFDAWMNRTKTKGVDLSIYSSIVIPKGITDIGDYAFSSFHNLQKISIPETVKSIGTNAFAGSGIRMVQIPDSVTYVGPGAFSQCRYLSFVRLSENMEKIEASTFSECDSLTTIHIPDSVARISSGAFEECLNLTEVTGMAGLKWIEARAFNISKKYERGRKRMSLSNIAIPKTCIYPKNAFFTGVKIDKF